jgi:hypothetical protein
VELRGAAAVPFLLQERSIQALSAFDLFQRDSGDVPRGTIGVRVGAAAVLRAREKQETVVQMLCSEGFTWNLCDE